MDGVLIIDKPAGMTSHDVIARVRKQLQVKRAGHTGTLDPFATGVLVVLLGRATRLAQFLSGAQKEYEGVIRLGYATDTGDITGKRIEPQLKSPSFSSSEIEAALKSLRGEIEQQPPMYSAKKVGGQKLYELARRGEEVERKAVRVTVFEFVAQGVLSKENENGTADLPVRVVCSAGTYVRTLAEAVGEHLGVGAHLAGLRRTRAGEFRIENAITLERVAELADSKSVEQLLISPDSALRHLPALDLDDEECRRARHGMEIQVEEANMAGWSDGERVRMKSVKGELIAVGTYSVARQAVHPGTVIVDQE